MLPCLRMLAVQAFDWRYEIQKVDHCGVISADPSSIFGGDGRSHGSTSSYSVCARTEFL